MYVYPDNPKQGDTVLIRVKGETNSASGKLGEENLAFYQKSKSEWVALLGIDADKEPGIYNISVSSGLDKFAKDISVSLADFSVAKPAKTPNVKKEGYTKNTALNNIVNVDGPALKQILTRFTQKPYFNGSFVFPLEEVEKSGYSFGRFIQFAKYKIQHLGVDLRAPEKTDIHAVNDGKVVSTINLSNGGKTVVIDHGLNIFSMYLHLEEFKVSEGDMVKRNQIIGLSGDTGYSTAPHLHFSMRVGSSRIDPIVFIQTTKKLDDDSILANISRAVLNVFNKE